MKNEKYTPQQFELAKELGYIIYRTLAFNTDPQTAMLSLTIATALCTVSCDAEMDYEAFRHNVEFFIKDIEKSSQEQVYNE